MRYNIKTDGRLWMIIDNRNGDAIGYVHSGIVAATVANAMNKHEASRG